ncbi:hypothetical protein [Streptomyces prunicolor]|uniref:hypothetical protein n=1 Tax=Streptomyces prunicolor TaxID=67348 RepID=UPI0034334CCC
MDDQGRPRGALRADQFGGDGPVAEIETLFGPETDHLHHIVTAPRFAIVGAYVLAGELAGTREDITGAFTRYERKPRPYTRQIQRSAPDSGQAMTPRTAHGITAPP